MEHCSSSLTCEVIWWGNFHKIAAHHVQALTTSDDLQGLPKVEVMVIANEE